MLLEVQPHVFLTANTAAPTTARMGVGIFRRKRMTVLAMRLFGIESSTSIDIHLVRHRLQMLGITAYRCFAQMIENQSFRDRSNEELVAVTVNVDIPVLDADESVTRLIRTAAPEPAAGIRFWVNLILQAFRQRRQSFGHCSTPVCQRWCAGVNLLEGT